VRLSFRFSAPALSAGYLSLPTTAYASDFAGAGLSEATAPPWLLVAMGIFVLFCALSAMYGLIFRRVCRNGYPPATFTVLQAAVFFAWAPLLGTIASALVGVPLEALGAPSMLLTVLYIVVTVCSTAWLARRFLLKATAAQLSFVKAATLTSITFGISAIIAQLLKMCLIGSA